MSPSNSAPGPLSQAGDDERLARWDELAPEDILDLQAHPMRGKQLELLQEVDAWLLAGGETGPCPTADALYEYAGGPGADPLAEHAQAQVHAHLRGCQECALLVETLAVPVPHELLAKPEARPAGRLLRFAPLAAAAAALALIVGSGMLRGSDSLAAWPEDPIVRGVEAGALLAPQGPCLANEDAPWNTAPLFEITPQEGADLYRVALRKNDGGAFGEGTTLLEIVGATPELAGDEALSPGHYTWEAWATIQGIERPLGSQDFRIVQDDQAALAFEHLAGPARVERLHRDGFRADARAAARALPQGPARDAYLSAPLR